MIGLLIMCFMVTSSYILLAISFKKVAIRIDYPLCEGIGIIFITVFSILLFNESLSLIKIIGLILLIMRIALIKLGTKKLVYYVQ